VRGFIHGHARGGNRTLTYGSWMSMRRRCQDPKCPAYMDYGGAGIVICERWQSYANFLADMGERPTVAHSIDRIDQSNNRKSNRQITFNGETLSLAQWALKIGINPKLVSLRLCRGWSEHDAMTLPRQGAGRRHPSILPEVLGLARCGGGGK
jgi:hypothetical protein